MGAESSTINDLDLENPLRDGHPMWIIQHGQYDEQNLVTVISNDNDDREIRNLFSKYVKILKTIRHPSIVRFIGSCNVGSQSNLVVERCIPLTSVVDELEPLEISSGLHGLVEGLSFLHEKMAIAHNNVCPDAVFVAHNGSWKLGELEHACKFLEVTPDYLQKSRKYRNEHSLSPEEKANTLMITAELGHTRDVYSFGIMVECLLERLQELGDLIKTFELRIQDECLNPDPRQRPKLTSLMDDQLFRNDLLSVRRFLQDITLKSLKERETFFRGLTRKLLGLPEEVVGKHLSQLLLCRFVLLDQHASLFIPNLLTPCTDVRPSTENQGGISPILTEVTFKQYLIPEILKAFHCHDYHIRMILLTHFPYFIHLFDKDVLETSILPQVLLGIRDINNDLAALSLHCLGDLVTVLGRDAVIGGRSKTYFTKGTPNFKHGSNFHTENQDVSNGMPPKTLLKELANSSLKDANKEKEVQKRKDEMERRRKERQERQKALKLKREQADIERNNQEEPITQKDIPRGEHSLIENLKSSMTEIRPTEASIDDGSYLITKQSPTKNKKSDDIPIEPDIYFTKEDGQSSENDWSDWENDLLEKEENLSKSPKRFEEAYIDKIDRNTSPNVIQQKLSDIDSELRLKKDDDFISQIPGDFMKSKTGEKSEIVETINIEDTSISHSVKKPVLKNALKLQSKKKSSPKHAKTVQQSTALGAEFDIKKIEIKKAAEPVVEELDFFADMAPDIKPSTTEKIVGTSKLHERSSMTSLDAPNVDFSNKLAYTETSASNEMGGGGWEEDFNWEEEGF